MNKLLFNKMAINLSEEEIIKIEKYIFKFELEFEKYLSNLQFNLDVVPEMNFPYINTNNFYLRNDDDFEINIENIEQSKNFKDGYFIKKNDTNDKTNF